MLRRALAAALALAGVVLIGQACLAQAGPVAPSPGLAPSGPPMYGVALSASPNALAAIPEGYRVKVPRLGIDLPIAEGVIQRDIEQQQTPEGFAFHLPGTAIPGRSGNTYIYSHARAGMFLSLWDARVGDEVLVTAPDGRTLRYAISEVRPRVSPNDISLAQPTDDERLTLQTSTGPVPEDPRFVVIAVPRN